MTKIYVAGPYRGATLLDSFDNMRRGMQASVELMKKGYAPFCPWLDFQYSLCVESPTIEQYQAVSIAFLKTCDCVLLIGDWQSSKGVAEEIKVAKYLSIPTYSDVADIYKTYPIKAEVTDATWL